MALTQQQIEELATLQASKAAEEAARTARDNRIAELEEQAKVEDLAKTLGVKPEQIKLEGNDYVVSPEKAYTQEQAKAYQDALGTHEEEGYRGGYKITDSVKNAKLVSDPDGLHAKLHIPKENLTHIDDTDLAKVSNVTNHYKEIETAERLEAERHAKEDRSKADQIANAMGIAGGSVTVKDGHAIIKNLPLEQAQALAPAFVTASAGIESDYLVQNAVINNTGNNSATLDIDLRNIGDAHINAVRTTIAEQKQQENQRKQHVQDIASSVGNVPVGADNGRPVLKGNYTEAEAEAISNGLNRKGMFERPVMLGGSINTSLVPSAEQPGKFNIAINDVEGAHANRETARDAFTPQLRTEYRERQELMKSRQELAELKKQSTGKVAQAPAQAPVDTPTTDRVANEPQAPTTAAPQASANAAAATTPDATKPVEKEATPTEASVAAKPVTAAPAMAESTAPKAEPNPVALDTALSGLTMDARAAAAAQEGNKQNPAPAAPVVAAKSEPSKPAVTAPKEEFNPGASELAAANTVANENKVLANANTLNKATAELENASVSIKEVTSGEGYNALENTHKERSAFKTETRAVEASEKELTFAKGADDFVHFKQGEIKDVKINASGEGQDTVINAANGALKPGHHTIEFNKSTGAGKIGFLTNNNEKMELLQGEQGVTVIIGEGSKQTIIDVKGATLDDMKMVEVNDKWTHEGLAQAKHVEEKRREEYNKRTDLAADKLDKALQKEGSAAEKLAASLKALDTDGDKKLSKDELSGLAGKLKLNNIEIAAIGKALKSSGMALSEEAVAMIKAPAETPAVAQAAGQDQQPVRR